MKAGQGRAGHRKEKEVCSLFASATGTCFERRRSRRKEGKSDPNHPCAVNRQRVRAGKGNTQGES
jgi:hypothetical protein